MPTLHRTPLYAEHVALRARMVPFAGYEMPVQYSSVLEEAKAVRLQGGLFDVSHMGQFRVRGKNALQAMDRIVSNDLSRLKLHQAQYNLVCNPEGGVIDDIIVYHRHEDEAFICVNASNRLTDFAWIRDHLDKSVTIEDASDELALLALQGPLAETWMSICSDAKLVQSLPYYWAAEARVFGFPCYLSRTGYTGEDGFEIYLDKGHAAETWNRLLELGRPKGLVPVGLGARDTLRMEMGYPLHGHEISPTIPPFEAGLNWVVKLKKSSEFIGQPALKRLNAEGPRRVLRGFAVEDRRMARPGARIFSPAKEPVGEVTSGTFSPHLHHPIALGFVDQRFSQATDFLLEVREELLPMHAHPLPFVPPKTKKKTE